MVELKNTIQKLDDNGKYEVLRHFDWLMMQVLFSSGLEEPYYIFIDNCILQDIKHHKNNESRHHRFLATCLIFKFISESSCLNAKIAIPASILYEFSGKKEFNDENDYLSAIKTLQDCLEPFELDVVTLGFSDYRDANKSIGAIQFDEKKITKLIKNIKMKEWNVELRKGNSITFPMAIAHRALPDNIKLKYFNEGYVRWILASIVETMILTNRKNDAHVRKNYRHDLTFTLSGLNKMKKGTIEGLGDLELLSYCDVTAQFQNDNQFTCLAITFDEKLFMSFLNRQTLVATHEPFVIGVDSDSDIKRKFEQISEGQSRLERAGQREQELRSKAALFYSEMKAIFT